MSNVSTFLFENHPIRTIQKDNCLWFIAQDICENLNIQNVTQALHRLDDDERSMLNIGRQGKVNIVNESGMYTLVLRSRDAVTKGSTSHRFRKWVTSEVLPTIRKTGSYSLTINLEQQQAIRQAVNQRAYRNGEHHQAVYHKLYAEFKIPRYQDLPASKFDDAIKFLGGIKINHIQFSDDELCTLAWCYKAGERMRKEIKLISDALYKLKSDFAPSFYSMGIEYTRTLENARIIIERETRHINPNNQSYLSDNWINVLPNIRIDKRLL